MKWLLGMWYQRLRGIDLEILWPACVSQSATMDMAKAAFALHAFNDPAWLFLGEQEVYRIIDSLGSETSDSISDPQEGK